MAALSKNGYEVARLAKTYTRTNGTEETRLYSVRSTGAILHKDARGAWKVTISAKEARDNGRTAADHIARFIELGFSREAV